MYYKQYHVSSLGREGRMTNAANLCSWPEKDGRWKCDAQFEVRGSSIDRPLTEWSCEDDCAYNCMWETVDHFLQHGHKVPQFHGKWPFARIYGFQEPASVIFSIFNFWAHVLMYIRFRKETRPGSPMALLWTYFTVVCLNAWFWSAIFHARDRPFTEMMDYSCAFAMVITLFYCMLMRIAYNNKKAYLVITCAYISILFTHLSHLWSGKINYGYNMKINILIGFLTFLITIIWWYLNHRRLRHAYLIGWFNILTVLVTLFEVADFPPYRWIFDAHALWHASTAPLTFFLYRFIISDCQYLRKQSTQVQLDYRQFYN
ncbi:post-GPI attachment to proteins factor 3 isoform X2 [Venturia canescens]|uniref:post-GPI attachment to proteins factor 3 isoform X2 n=1 Tax=Venturia canescens TaxID=32260 RepID=UPI001C9CF3D5|nr:post-GPI attachment to proteins factor 3 isoform X2 [Venturia canescens]